MCSFCINLSMVASFWLVKKKQLFLHKLPTMLRTWNQRRWHQCIFKFSFELSHLNLNLRELKNKLIQLLCAITSIFAWMSDKHSHLMPFDKNEPCKWHVSVCSKRIWRDSIMGHMTTSPQNCFVTNPQVTSHPLTHFHYVYTKYHFNSFIQGSL